MESTDAFDTSVKCSHHFLSHAIFLLPVVGQGRRFIYLDSVLIACSLLTFISGSIPENPRMDLSGIRVLRVGYSQNRP